MGSIRAFAYTGAIQSFTVPAGVTSLRVTLKGAGGGGTAGGAGGLVVGNLAVTPGQVVYIVVGGRGADGGVAKSAQGGWPTGGDSVSQPLGVGGGGGGATSDIRVGGTAVANRVAVAAGGGGASGSNVDGSNGGGTSGVAGTFVSSTSGGGGGGGTQAAGGAGGIAGTGGTAGTAGGTAAAGGVGGNGGNATTNTSAGRGGGGGGGGYYGGGGGGGYTGGGGGGGGGGGSSYTGGLTSATNTTGGGSLARQDGSISISYNQPPSAPVTSSPAAGNYADPTQPLPFTWTFGDPDTADAQAAVSLQYRLVGAGTWTDLLLLATPYASSSYTAAANTFAAGVYEWRVAASDGTVTGPYSAASQFTISAPPAAPTITAPLSQLTANPATVTWTTPGAQVAYQAQYVADDGAGNANPSVVYSDTGQVNSATQSVALGLGTAINGGTLHVRVRHQQNPGLWSAWADAGVETINVGQPGVPTLAFSSSAATGAITVTITNPAVPSPTVTQDLFRTDVQAIDLNVDYTARTSVPAAADSLQPMQLTGQPLKIQAASLAMNYTGSGAARSDVQYQLAQRINRMRAEFLFESATWTTDGAILGLFALVSPYLGGTLTPNSHCYLTIGRTSWGLAYVSGATLTSLLTGTYPALPLDTVLSAEVSINPYTNTASIWLPDGSVKTITNSVFATISGVVADAVISLAAANTDRRPRLRNFWASGEADFGELRIKAGLAPNVSVTDYTPASDRVYRYRAQAYAFYGGTVSSA